MESVQTVWKQTTFGEIIDGVSPPGCLEADDIR